MPPRPPRPQGNQPPRRPKPKPGDRPRRNEPAAARKGPAAGPQRARRGSQRSRRSPQRARRPAPPGVSKPSNPRRSPDQDAPGSERLQKILAHAGVGSRRSCEELILQGRISVGGKIIRELGTKVDPAKTPVAARRPEGPGRAAGVLRRLQAKRVRLDQQRSGGPAQGARHPARDPPTGLHGRPARRDECRPDAPDQRRGTRQPVGPPQDSGSRSSIGSSSPARPPARSSTNWSRGSGWPRGRSGPRASGRSAPGATRRSSNSSSPRGRTGKSGGCWPSSVTR